ncbi:MAG: hypothetical protein ACHQF4_10965 [Sphingobacteriales bacterium]
MKKLLLIPTVVLALIILTSASCRQKANQNDAQTKENTKAANSALTPLTPPPNTFTLDGTSSQDADDMIKAFINNSGEGSYNQTNRACVLFSKTELQEMCKTLSTEGDGIRLYFAKDASSYTVIAVSTKDGGVDKKHPHRHFHNDYFQATKPFGELGNIGDPNDKGAKLYAAVTPCDGSDNCPGKNPHYISCATAYTMVNNYNSDPINATSEWFDKAIINDLISLIPTNGGIRIYYGKHLSGTEYDSTPRDGVVIIVTQPNLQDYFVCLPIHPTYKVFHPLIGGGTDNGEECPTNCTINPWIDPNQ